MNEEYEGLKIPAWASRSEWKENHLRSRNSYSPEQENSLEAYDSNKPLCRDCAESIGVKIRLKISIEPNVLHIQRKIFI